MKKNKNIAQTIGIGVVALLLIGLTAGVISSLNDVNDNIIQPSNNKCNEITYSSNATIYEFEEENETALSMHEVQSEFSEAVEAGHNKESQDFAYIGGSGPSSVWLGNQFPLFSVQSYDVFVTLATLDYETFANNASFQVVEYDDAEGVHNIMDEIKFSDINYEYEMNSCNFTLFCFKKIKIGTITIDPEELYLFSYVIQYRESEGPDDIVPECPLVLLDSLIFEPTDTVKARSNYKEDSKESDIVICEEDPLGYLPWGPLV